MTRRSLRPLLLQLLLSLVITRSPWLVGNRRRPQICKLIDLNALTSELHLSTFQSVPGHAERYCANLEDHTTQASSYAFQRAPCNASLSSLPVFVAVDRLSRKTCYSVVETEDHLFASYLQTRSEAGDGRGANANGAVVKECSWRVVKPICDLVEEIDGGFG